MRQSRKGLITAEVDCPPEHGIKPTARESHTFSAVSKWLQNLQQRVCPAPPGQPVHAEDNNLLLLLATA